jgi:hypothetical protein
VIMLGQVFEVVEKNAETEDGGVANYDEESV